MKPSKNTRISLNEFLDLSKTHTVFDVRSESEYAHAHIPGALSLPIFTDSERAEIGTMYKQVSKETAIELGFRFFGPKLNEYILKAQSHGIQKDSTILIHCWRGGMRSEAMAWVMNFYGFQALTLEGGYKAYRNHVLSTFERLLPAFVIGGYTGSGKTEILHELHSMHEPIIDLEGIAYHRGSSFGSIGCPEQTSQEYFENRLAMSYPSESIDHLWIEDESRKIGKNIVPQTLHGIIRSSPIIFLDIPREARLNWLVEQYVDQDFSLIEDAVIRIGKRLGGLQAGRALEAIKAGDLHACFEIALRYYDDTYDFGVSKRDQSTIHRLQMQEVNHRGNAEAILEFAQTIKKGMHE
jgi:tRNA 2-selenouridine synthase